MTTHSSAKPNVKLRLTARGQAVLVGLVAILVSIIAMMFVFGVTGAQATGDAGSNDFTYVSVASGQSLWQLATDIAPDADPRDVIAEIVQLNALPSADVEAGQRIALPEKYAR